MFNRIYLAAFVLTGVFSAIPQVAQAQCNTCCNQSTCNKCRPNNTRIIVWRSNIVNGGLSPVIGGAPPQGFAVNTFPGIVTSQAGIAVNPVSFANVGSGSATVSTADLAELIRRSGAASGSAGGAASAAPTTNNTCPDPCGSIIQLQQDVKDLTTAIGKITSKLEELDRRAPKLP